ncbi:uncharacterized protein KY384_003598 [Bacidia gigantensis]|uniref:uncharacterized protein n=1 Tax=Bacidia gigantensis TaxID=2732470 RepID=UPI001D051BAC|nr:uncharacterized protein KY384_003598 [Bacidia gigantensis]KAG8531962.1 hypothetical protein KY384_003598 [Bacidia gigantensis]
MDLVAGVRKEGSRGGRADFKWEDVKDDAQRENYLGHSLMAPVGRWQKGRDLNWYAKSDQSPAAQTAAEARKEEIRRIKEAEQDALSAALGYEPIPRGNPNETPLGKKEVEKAIRETAEGDEPESAKGIGFGAFEGLRKGKGGGDTEMLEGVGFEQSNATQAPSNDGIEEVEVGTRVENAVTAGVKMRMRDTAAGIGRGTVDLEETIGIDQEATKHRGGTYILKTGGDFAAIRLNIGEEDMILGSGMMSAGDLPIELRHKIYRNLLVSPSNGKIERWHVKQTDSAFRVSKKFQGILEVNRQIRKEALYVFYYESIFELYWSGWVKAQQPISDRSFKDRMRASRTIDFRRIRKLHVIPSRGSPNPLDKYELVKEYHCLNSMISAVQLALSANHQLEYLLVESLALEFDQEGVATMKNQRKWKVWPLQRPTTDSLNSLRALKNVPHVYFHAYNKVQWPFLRALERSMAENDVPLKDATESNEVDPEDANNSGKRDLLYKTFRCKPLYEEDILSQFRTR